MKYFVVLVVMVILQVSYVVNAQQQAQKDAPYRVTGTLMDKSSGEPIQYATVTLLEKPDSIIVSGIITDEKGKFTIGAKHPGEYTLRIKFIGYESFYKDIKLSEQDGLIDLGRITVGSSSVTIGEVSVSAVDRSIDYEIDRKVVHVDKQYASLSGNAIDVLKNVPSIQVDIENNVAIRGNSNFTVLIDGRPSVLEGSEALQQIPAGMIKDIEIITNPSAKFDPEGTAGIINIITKKRTITGLSGISHADIGLDDKYGADFLLNYRTQEFNFFIGGDYNNRTYPGTIERRQETYNGDSVSFLNSQGNYQRAYEGYSGRVGAEWFPDDKNVLSLKGRYGYRSMAHSSNTNYEEWNNYTTGIDRYTNEDKWERDGNFYSINGEYTHNFNGNKSKEKHRLDVHAMLFKREGDEESINFLYDSIDNKTRGQRSTESGPGRGVRYRVNYQQPFSKAFKIETGLQGRIHSSEETNALYDYIPDSNEFFKQDKYSHDVTYERNINGLYGLMKGEYYSFGYQLGLRGEYTYRDINMKDEGNFNIDRWDFFPTAHVSYQLAEKNQFMVSYSRRIRRPRGWYLEPFITWRDAYNVRRGNPDLLPEYINSYELGYQVDFNKQYSLSAEVYHRASENEIERIRSVWQDNIMLTTFQNVGTEYRTGLELMFNTDLFDWWESDLIGNFFDYRVKGQINNRKIDRGSFTWEARWNNIFRVLKNTRIQINPEYESREVEAQDIDYPEFEVDGAIRQSFMNNNLSLTLQVRDIFATGKHESETDEVDFYSYRLYKHRAPIVMLNITWRINNYQNGKNGNNGDGGEGMEGGEDGI